MSNVALLSQVYRGKWFINPAFAISQGPVLAALMNGQTVMEPFSDRTEEDACNYAYAIKPGAANVGPYSLKYRSDDIPPNSIAIIRLQGALMKNDYCGDPGMQTIGNYIKQADKHENITKIILHVDSPGGTVDGTEDLANIIKGIETPIEALVDGMACSAGIWISSACDKLWAMNDFAEVGSVGVLLSFADVQPYYEKMGVKFHTITASTSPDKRKQFNELLAGNYENYIKEVLNPLDERFMETIRQNRPGVKEEHLSGKVFFAKDVIGSFVDGIKTLDQLINESISGSVSGAASAINNQNYKSMEELTALAAVFATAELELEVDADGGLYLNTEQLEAFNATLEQSDSVTLATERDSALAAQQTAESELATANERITALEQELEKKPGAESASATPSTDKKKTSAGASDEFETLANAGELYKSIKQ